MGFLTRVVRGNREAQIDLIDIANRLGVSFRIMKGESKMLNVEKYRDRILEDAEKLDEDKYYSTIFQVCADLAGRDTYSSEVPAIFDWLFADAEGKLLEDGSDLKFGEKILVKNSRVDDWKERFFIAYQKDVFIATSDMDIHDLTSTTLLADIGTWKYAKRPAGGASND